MKINLPDLLNYLLDASDKKMTIRSNYFNGRSGVKASRFWNLPPIAWAPRNSLFLMMVKEWRKRIYFY